MDSGIADTLNRIDVLRMCRTLDQLDVEWKSETPWYSLNWADAIVEEPNRADAGHADLSWIVGAVAARTPDVRFDGQPAGCDWEGLFGHFRAEILARRGPQSPPAQAAETQLSCVV